MAMGRRNVSACGGLTIEYLDWSAPTSLANAPTTSAVGGGTVNPAVGAAGLGGYQNYSQLKWEDAVLAADDCVYVIPTSKASSSSAPILRFNPDNSVTVVSQELAMTGSSTGVAYLASRNMLFWVDSAGSVLSFDISSGAFAYVPLLPGVSMVGTYPMVCGDGNVWFFKFNLFATAFTACRIDATTMTMQQVAFAISGARVPVGGLTFDPGHTFALHPDGNVYAGSELCVAKININNQTIVLSPQSVDRCFSARVLPNQKVLFGGVSFDYLHAYDPSLNTSLQQAPLSTQPFWMQSAAVGCNGNVFVLSDTSTQLSEINPNTGVRHNYALSNASGGATKWRSIVQRSDNTLVITPGSGNTFAVVSLNSPPPNGWQHSPYVTKR